ncbi:relaxase domain-containing protein [Nocardia abscessus]|uniref:MobF family relaxase n=1 Tax=Nocardia abscessus TaxID=120957 RepID=UPI0018944E02|nr:MobF family relaxase [Nocardia abscessus]MBF6341258.1 relaxase domain-containing protein [Nocardia abscessus]
MTVTLAKISAGDGYQYYLRHVAAHDATERGRSSLADYYSAHGESPGRWFGAGLTGLAVHYRGMPVEGSAVLAGDVVTEPQMKALLGLGRHPQAEAIEAVVIAEEIGRGAKRKDAKRAASQASRLGAPFRIYNGASEYRKRCAVAFNDYNTARGLHRYAPIPEEQRAAIRTGVARKMFIERFARPPLDDRELSGWVTRNSRQHTTAVAGFDWTFSPVKSVSTLWGVAPRDVAKLIEQAHHLAVADAMRYLEQHATYTRVGRNGVRQVEVDGLIAAMFDHRESRAGDPDLHTHVVCPNKVRAADGQWRALDGAVFYRAAVTASEIYNTRLEMYLERLLGLRFAERAGLDPGKRPIREIVGVDPALNEYWSRRDAAITARLGELTVAHQATYGREPLPVEMYQLVQRAILDTRGPKPPARSLAEQRAAWRRQALAVLGGQAGLAAMIAAALHPGAPVRPVIDAAWIARCTDRVIATVSAQRSVWRRAHVRAEVERVIRGVVPLAQWARVGAAIEEQALAPTRSVARGDPDVAAHPELAAVPVLFRRPDGHSVYNTADAQLYTAPKVLAGEADLIEMAQQRDGRAVPASVVDAAIAAFSADPGNRERRLNEGQLATVRAFATSGAGVQMANAPAGSGKTTAMRVLTDAWLASGGTVLGLAPTARAAAVLAGDIRVRVETVDKLLHVLARHTPTRERFLFEPDRLPPPLPQWVLDIDDRTLVIVDEHVQIADAARLRLLMFLRSRRATVRLVGDTEQLPAIDAGGAVQDMIHAAGPRTQTLTHIVRFVDDAEGEASLLLREGDPAGLAYYLDHGRIHVGSPAAVADAAFTGWLADQTAGRDSVMLAATHTTVTELNRLAREHRLTTSTQLAGGQVELADTLHASVGDTIRTGLNNPRLSVGGDDYVRNGYRWIVTAVHADGSLSAQQLLEHRQLGARVWLPGDYVAAHVRLGYAATIGSAQGITADTCHTALTGHETRPQLYVAVTRGRAGNHLYLTTTVDGDEPSFWTEEAVLPRTGLEILTRILGRADTDTSAHSELRDALDPWRRLGRATDIYLDALSVAIDHVLGATVLARIDRDAEALWPGLTRSRGYVVLRQHLARLLLAGRDAIAELAAAIKARELGSADDVAAVLDWRLDTSGAHSAPPGPLPWVPGIPQPLRSDPDVGGFLAARARIITELAGQIRTAAARFTPASAPLWARPLLGADPGLIGDLAVWRAGAHVDDLDRRPAGPARFVAAERHHHELLTARASEAIGDVNLAANKWSPVAERIAVGVTDDPFWPVLAERLDTADRAGIDVPALLATAAALRPLPDEMPAAVLWSRLTLGPSALDTPSTRAHLTPAWTPELRAVLGEDAAERVLADPAWPRVVAAIDRAADTAWTPRELLEVASELLVGGRGDHDSDRLRPDQFATALAWRIDAITRAVPTYPDPPPAEPSDFDDHPATEPDTPPVPDHIAATLSAPPEATMVDDTPPQPATDPAVHPPEGAAAETDSEAVPLAAQIRAAAALAKAGHHTSAAEAIARITDAASPLERDTLHRVQETLRRYAFPVARARLEHAATLFPDRADLIRACIPDTDAGIFQRENDTRQPRYRRDQAPRDSRRWIDPTRKVPTDNQRGEPDLVYDHTTRYLDYIIQPNPDDRTRHDEHLPEGTARLIDSDDDRPVRRPTLHKRDEPDPLDKHTGTGRTRHRDDNPGRDEHLNALLEPLRDLPCVGCGFERPHIDRPAFDPGTGDTERDDGLCRDCRDHGVAGIPDHNPDQYLEARCAHIASTRPAQEALAFLHRDWRRVGLANRHRIRAWVLEHGLKDQADLARASESVRDLSDAQLSEHIEQTRRKIALTTSMNAAETLPASPAISDPSVVRTQGVAAADAIAHARSAAATVDELGKQLHSISRKVAATRTQLVAAKSDVQALQTALTAFSQTKQQLIQAVAAAKRTAQDAHRDAELLAGPSDRWDEILAHPGKIPPPSATASEAATSADHKHLHRQLEQLRAEQRRRATLPQARHESGQAPRPAAHRAPELAALDPPEHINGPAISAPTDDLGL